MAFPTFGVTATTIAYRFQGQDLSSLATEIAHWLQQDAGILDGVLRKVGFTVAEASAEGVDSSLYRHCQAYLESRITAKVARSEAHRNVPLAEEEERQAAEVMQIIKDRPETLSDAFDRDEHYGSWRWGRASSSSGTTRRRRWARGGRL